MSPQEDFSNIQIESSLPKVWEQEQTFNDVLYDWMSRAPFLAIALAIHLLAFFAVNAIPWNLFNKEQPATFQATAPPPPPEQFEEPEPEEPEEIIDEPIEEPVITDSEITEDSEVSDDVSDLDAPESPFKSDQFNSALGLGGGAGGGGGKIGGRQSGRKQVGGSIERALLNGLEWLKDHQSPNGSWEARDFAENCEREGGDELANGEGDALHDTGVTALALLAFLGFGDTMDSGTYSDVIRSGVRWLSSQQDRDSGLIGPSTSREYLYDHAIATLALSEAYYGAKTPLLKKAVTKAAEYCIDAQNPYSAWRYEVPPNSENDTSVTGWMVFALASAQDAGIEVGNGTFEGALSWLDEVTDPLTGRAGYNSRGGPSSRLPRLISTFPDELTEAMTAVSVLSRIFIHNVQGTDAEDDELIQLGADLMLENLPAWDTAGGGGGDSGWAEDDAGSTNDMYYWYYGSYAMFQLGGQHWEKWRKEMEKAILSSQREAPPCYHGSWDPSGPWGHSGGRVYSTALMVLCLEVYFRYSRVLGAR